MKAWKYLIGVAIIVACGMMTYMGSRANEQQIQAFAALAHVAESEENLDEFIAAMTTEEKIGQMIQIERNYLRYREIAKYQLGSVLSGGGSADVLFGDHNFTGKLPVSWPKSATQLPLNVGQPGYDPLFPMTLA